MTDYKEEQKSEIESLSFLYEEGKEITYINKNTFKILVKNERNKLSLSLLFEYPEKYPSEPPIVKIVEENRINEFVKKNVQKTIDQVIEENLGFTMVYSIVEGVRTFLMELPEEKSMHDEMLLNQKETKKGKSTKTVKFAFNHLDEVEDEEENGNYEQQEKTSDDDMDEVNDDDGELNGFEYDDEDDDTNYENVLGLKELCDEKYRVSEEEFNAWRIEFYKDILRSLHDRNNMENPSGREIFEKGKFAEMNDNLEDVDIEDDVHWKDAKLFADIDLGV